MKKRICMLFLAVSMILLLGGCGDEKEEPGIISLDEKGEWQKNSYVLSEYNFTFWKPEAWTRLLPSEISSIFGEGASDYYKMIVVNNTQKIIVSLFFEDSQGAAQEEYIKNIQEKMEKEEGVTYQFEESEVEVIGGIEFVRLNSSIAAGGEEGALSNQINLVHEQGDRMLCINIKYDSTYQEAVNTMITDYFKPYLATETE